MWWYADNQRFAPIDDEQTEVVKGFQKAFNCCALPVTHADGEKAATVIWTSHDEDEIKMEISAGTARNYLRHWLENKRKGTFPLMRLPAELRNTIYELVFSYPKSGIVVQSAKAMHLLNRLEDARTNTRDTTQDFEDQALGFDIKEHQVLALLQANRQLFVEAAPFFYSLNTFSCIFFRGTVQFLSRMGVERIRHFKSLDLELGLTSDREPLRAFPSAMRKFAASDVKLTRLEIHIRGRQWTQMNSDCRRELGRKTAFKSLGQVLGMIDLARVCARVEDLITDDEDEFGKWVRVDIQKLNDEAAQARGKGKGSVRKRKTKAGKIQEGLKEENGTEQKRTKKIKKA